MAEDSQEGLSQRKEGVSAMTAPRLCRNCRWVDAQGNTGVLWVCQHPTLLAPLAPIDVVTGRQDGGDWPTCRVARRDYAGLVMCGPSGALWEARP